MNGRNVFSTDFFFWSKLAGVPHFLGDRRQFLGHNPYIENALDEDFNKKTTEIPQRTRIFTANHCEKLRNAPLNKHRHFRDKLIILKQYDILPSKANKCKERWASRWTDRQRKFYNFNTVLEEHALTRK